MAWIDRAPAESPPIGDVPLLVFDQARSRIIAAGQVYPDGWQTWEFDPSGAWLQIGSSGPPVGYSAMAYDAARLRGVLFGGQTGTGNTAQTWEWNGAVSGGPTILTQPDSIIRDPGQSAVFTIGAIGTGPLRYQWLHEGQAMSNGGGISGVNSDTLMIANAMIANTGLYSVRVTDACGPTTSTAAYLRVTCFANCDNSTSPPILNVMDWICFQTHYAAGCTSPTNCYPNCDGSTTAPYLNVNDFICFMTRYMQGCI